MTQQNEMEASQLTLLLLDDEQDILNALKRLLRKMFTLVTFTQGQAALDYLQDNTVDLIISDMRMPNMDGAEFLAKSRNLHPETMRLLLTGYSDMDSTIKAINDGGVYCYIGKPWDNDALKMTLDKAAEHYCLKKEAKKLGENLLAANKELESFNKSLEKKVTERTSALESSKQKLQGSLKTQKSLLQDVLEMMSSTIEYRTGVGSGHTRRIALQCKAIAVHLGFDEAQCRFTYLSALLHEIGKVGLSDDALKQNKFDSDNLNEALASHPVIGAEIVGRVKRFAILTENIRHQDENYDGTGLPKHLKAEDIPIGARIIRVVKDFDHLIAGKNNHHRMSIKDAKNWIVTRVNIWYDKGVVDAFFAILSDRQDDEEGMEYSIGLESVKIGDTLIEDLVLNGNVMLKEGQQVSQLIIEKLSEYERDNNVKLTLFVT
jgi:response regulator RpfG family c-di-GMP phosphodiesterase